MATSVAETIVTNGLFARRASLVVRRNEFDGFLGVARQNEGETILQCKHAAEIYVVLRQMLACLPRELGSLRQISLQDSND